jgi:tetratricopeptide (TPR) repeat protein
MSAGDTALEDENFASAERKYQAAYEILQANSIEDDRLTMTLESLGEALWKQGKFEEAQPYCEMTLALYENLLGPKHDDVGIVAHNLAMLYHANKNNAKAEEMYKRALSIRSSIVGSSHPESLSIMTNYANLLHSIKRDVEATNMRNHVRSLSSGRWSACGQFKALTAPQAKQTEDARTTGTLVYERLVETVEKHGKNRKDKSKR